MTTSLPTPTSISSGQNSNAGAIKDPPCDAIDAVCRARSIVGKGGQYLLGTGDYHPTAAGTSGAPAVDLPWSPSGSGSGSDCAGFAICWAWKLRRHRPGFNRGPWATVSDDINCNSALEDAQHHQELFILPPLGDIKPGDLLLYPTFQLSDSSGLVHQFIGHVGLVESVPSGWTPAQTYLPLSVIQCHGPNGFSPGVVRTDGSIWAHHDLVWPKEQHRVHVVRPKARG